MYQIEEATTSRALPTEEALRQATSLAELLRQMHRDGVVCGHLDPKNIVWDTHRVRLALTEAGSACGYLAPEQVRGEAADARSDIFAFGAILYEMLSGRRAFPAEGPEEWRRQILEYTPPPLEGIPDGISSLLRGCLEKDRSLRCQRMNFILIELKLANASARQALSASEWRDKVLSLRSQVSAHDERLADQQMAQESAAMEFRQAIAGIEEAQSAIQESIAALQKGERIHNTAIEGLNVAASQTDEVVEHVVEAFGMMHKAMVERGDAKVLLVARSGN
jgi:eukaryotic-like serine/threonine-protein kinase